MLFQRTCPGCGARASSAVTCRRCAEILAAAGPFDVEAPAGLDALIAAHRYQGVARRLVLAAKNGGQRALLRRWGRESAALAGAFAGVDVVTWVPASRLGARTRGYDQGRILARSVATALDLPARRLLVRRPGPSRVGSGRDERLSGPLLRCPVRCPPAVLLVDDVVTTGASMAAAAGALRAAGATRVVGLVVAVAGDFPAIRAFDPDDRVARQHYG